MKLLLSLYFAKQNHETLFAKFFAIIIFLNAQFMFYFLIICYEIYIKLIHFNVRWFEMIIYRMIYDEMFVRKFLIHIRMIKFVKMFISILFFAIYDFAHMLKYDETFFVCNERMFRISTFFNIFIFVCMFEFWRNVLINDDMFRNLWFLFVC